MAVVGVPWHEPAFFATDLLMENMSFEQVCTAYR